MGVVVKSYMRNIRGNAQYNHKREGHLSYMTLQPIPSEYIRGKFYFFFIRVPLFNSGVAHILKPLLISMKGGKQTYVAWTV
jgi:hypothetical protein